MRGIDYKFEGIISQKKNKQMINILCNRADVKDVKFDLRDYLAAWKLSNLRKFNTTNRITG